MLSEPIQLGDDVMKLLERLGGLLANAKMVEEKKNLWRFDHASLEPTLAELLARLEELQILQKVRKIPSHFLNSSQPPFSQGSGCNVWRIAGPTQINENSAHIIPVRIISDQPRFVPGHALALGFATHIDAPVIISPQLEFIVALPPPANPQ